MRKEKQFISRLLNSSYAWSFIAKGIHIILGLFITVFINRSLGADLKGQYAYVNNVITVLTIIGGIGLYHLYPFYRRQKGQQVKNEFVNISFSLMLIYLFLSFIYIIAFSYNVIGDVIIINCLMCFIIITKIADSQFAMFASVDNFKKCKRIGIFLNFGRFIILLLIFLFFKRNIIAVLIGDLIYDFIGLYLYFKIIDIPYGELKVSFQRIGSIVKIGYIPMLFQLLLQLNYSIDILYMKIFSTVTLADIGLYSVGVHLAAYIWTIPDIFKEVLYSKTAKDDSTTDIIWCLRISLFVEILFLLFICLFGDQVLLFLYGEEFVPAITVTKIIFFGVLSMTLFKVLTPLYNAKGQFKVNLLILATSVTINVFLNIALIPKFGMIGAAFASVFGYFACGIIYLFRFCKDFSITFKQLLFFNRKDIFALLQNHNVLKR